MALNDPKLDRLIALIQDSFRIRENHDPTYVDVGGHLSRVLAAQHQVIFGRRGSGKSSLLVTCHRQVRKHGLMSVYVSADEVTFLTYPDVLIRLLLTLFERTKSRAFPWYSLRRGRKQFKHIIRDLRSQLDEAEEASTVREIQRDSDKGLEAGVAAGGAQFTARTGRRQAEMMRSAFSTRKIEYLERHLQDFKQVFQTAIKASGTKHVLFILDDFYLIQQPIQPDVIDYLHRLVRGLDAYLKIGTVRHRTTLMRQEQQTIGVELYGDVEPIDLDHTLDDLPRTRDFLGEMLNAMGKKCDIDSAKTEYFNVDALEELVLASGGVPRDFLTIFVEAVRASRAAHRENWLTPTYVYKAAHRVSYRTKLNNLREDIAGESDPLARVFVDLLSYCLQEKKQTLFLISQDEAQERPAQHELIKQLMDFRLIHIVEADTSAASGRPGRYEAYTLDFSTFMEPRRRGIEIVEFWKEDDQHRRLGLREAPVYSLERAARVLDQSDVASAEQELATLEERLKEAPIQRADGGASAQEKSNAGEDEAGAAGLFDDIEQP